MLEANDDVLGLNWKYKKIFSADSPEKTRN